MRNFICIFDDFWGYYPIKIVATSFNHAREKFIEFLINEGGCDRSIVEGHIIIFDLDLIEEF